MEYFGEWSGGKHEVITCCLSLRQFSVLDVTLSQICACHCIKCFFSFMSHSSQDKRLSGGYENVPTDDIHMNQARISHYYFTVSFSSSRRWRGRVVRVLDL